MIPSAQELLATARERTGLVNVGDERFMTALDRLVRSVNAESTLSNEGREQTRERWLRLLCNRLWIEADLALHPEILAQPLQPPLVICGLPRVGSTKLHQLMARASDFQSLIFWQGFNPGRRPTLADGGDRDRIHEAVRFLEWRSRRNPKADAAHFLAASEPEEDTYLLEYALHTWWPVSYWEAPSFIDWVRGEDKQHVYDYVRMLLQYLQWQFHRSAPRPWVLKSPPNLGNEMEMTRALPGAKFVMLHRDPVETIPSTVAIVRELRRLYGEGAGDLARVGAWALREFGGAMDRHLAWRRTLPAGAVLDLPYAEIRDDYESAVGKVYEFCGMPLTAQALDRMKTWAGDNEQHKHGLHQYSLDEAGLSETAVRHRFRDYIDAFSRYLTA